MQMTLSGNFSFHGQSPHGELPRGCTKPKRMTPVRQKMANLELNIEFVIRGESFTLEQTNELCTRI